MTQQDLSNVPLDQPVHLTGSCLCAGVRYRIEGTVRGVVNCFCSQCQKTSGHYVAATRVNNHELLIDSDTTLKWYDSSPGYQRGFCHRCGSSLFWRRLDSDQTSVMAGTLDKPTGLKTVASIHEQDASDYFEIPKISI